MGRGGWLGVRRRTRHGDLPRAGEGAGGGSVSEPKRRIQAFVELLAEDPEAVSARAIARERLAAGRRLKSLRRLRVFELAGALPARAECEALLHRSTRFFNPAKERCTVRP